MSIAQGVKPAGHFVEQLTGFFYQLLVCPPDRPEVSGHMARWLAGIAAIPLRITGGILAFGRNAEEFSPPPALEPRLAAAVALSPIPNAPEADAKSKEAKRFARADRDEDGRSGRSTSSRARTQTGAYH